MNFVAFQTCGQELRKWIEEKLFVLAIIRVGISAVQVRLSASATVLNSALHVS